MSQKFDSSDTSSPIWRAKSPYDALLRLPPRLDVETKVVLRQCITARAAVAALHQAAKLIPNAGMLINTLPVLEAQASSAIENVVTTADKLFRLMSVDSATDPATREAHRYREALLEGARKRSFALSTRGAEWICTRIRGVETRVRKVPGTRIVNAGTGDVVYTPPEGEQLLRALLSNWERYIHEESALDPLIRMAVAHYQFEAVHPFVDGNGRTGRVLNSLFLVDKGLLELPILYLSHYIIQRKADYYRLLLAVTADEEWEAWILFMLRGVEETAVWTADKIAAIRNLARHTRVRVRTALPKIYSRELVDVLFQQPYCRIGHLVDSGIVKRQAASRYLKELARIGVLHEEKVGREKLFVHSKLLSLLAEDSNQFEPYP